jgi:cytochrome P450
VLSPAYPEPGLFDSPDEFDAERFMAPRNEHKRDIYKFHPFGRGRHPCPGEKFARIEIKNLLMLLPKYCDFELITTDYEDHIDRAQATGLSRPKVPVMVKISKKL